MKNKDTIYAKPVAKVTDFEFNEQVSLVFDNMISRSVPLYHEIQRSSVDLISIFAKPNTAIYDLGCASGTTLELLGKTITDQSIKIIGVDNSQSMLQTCNNKLTKEKIFNVKLIDADICEIEFQKSSAIILNYTLQFIEVNKRKRLLQKIFTSLCKGGILLLSEKVSHRSKILGKEFYQLHHKFKSDKGYSQLEISQKRDSLENVLIPLEIEENIKLLAECAFQEIEIFAKWYNWVSIVALK